jgi:putative radical SAM enzyme (TIGR03279 family)
MPRGERRAVTVQGITVNAVAAGLPGQACGIRKGDQVLSVNGIPVADETDFRFGTAQQVSHVMVRRNRNVISLKLLRPHNTETGVTFADAGIAWCSNHCIFCFIDQMPPGLRASLYVKDEDVMHSFVNGNYVTLAAMTRARLGRLCRLGLSPLYVSVHATDHAVRQRMLGNRNIGDIMDQLTFLERNGIRFHAQIVVCPGFNDGPVLTRTILDLCGFAKGLLSVAVVPVGLTKYQNRVLKPVGRDEAQRICSEVAALGDSDLRRIGRRRVFCADELFIAAGLPMPPGRYYEEYPQLENGVGLVRRLLDEWRTAKRALAAGRTTRRNAARARPVLLVTSESAYPYIARFAGELPEFFPCLQILAIAAKNDFFGGHVTIAGLLTAADIIRAVKKTGCRGARVILPGVVLNRFGHTLDGYSLKRIGTTLGAAVSAAGSISELVRLL